MKRKRHECECGDHCCPFHVGRDCDKLSVTILYRSDMDDRTGVRFCNGCASDALESGVFGDSKPLAPGRDEYGQFIGKDA